MKMTLRWYGPGYDSVTLEQIRQIPGVTGVISTLYDVPAGEEWTFERVKELKDIVEAAGLKLEGIESVNIHDSIKIGSPDRDKYIDPLRHWERTTFTWYVTTSCPYSTGPELTWQRGDPTDQRFLPMIRR